MPILFGQVVIPHKNTITGDTIVNTFNFSGVDDVEDMATAIAGRLSAFYETTPPSATQPLLYYMSSELNYPGARLRLYNEADAEPRVPVYDESLGLVQPTPSTSLNLPGEVALCASYSARVESGQNRRRTRGRVYIGPLNTGVLQNDTNGTARPVTAFRTTLGNAAQKLAEDSTLGAMWGVWSRRDSSFALISQGYVDNAFDTQRRRGVPASGRTNWEVETDPL